MKSALKKDFKIAKKLIKKLASLRIIKYFLGLVLIILVTPMLIFAVIKPKTQENIEYGITFSDKYAQEMGLDWKDTYIKILDDLGTKNLRLVAYWDHIEKTQGEYDYSNIEWQLEQAEIRDIRVILTVGRKVPRWPECFEPVWWRRIEDESVRNEYLYKYVEKSIKQLSKYKSIKMWQVENEPFFPFGECMKIRKDVVEKEITIVRELDSRPILIQDSGEGGFWFPSYQMGDYLAISMYRKIWFDFWGVVFGKSIYFQYPLSHWTYKIKADMVGVPFQKVIVTELQAEPWGPRINSELTEKQKNKTMSKNDFLSTLSYAQKAGFREFYLWGAEWWLWEKEINNNSFYWDTAKALFR